MDAVDYLSRGHRPGLTVYDALEEALRWHTAALIARSHDELAVGKLPWDDPDPLQTALAALVAQPPGGGSAVDRAIHRALGAWAEQMALEFNDGYRWASPVRQSADIPALLLAD